MEQNTKPIKGRFLSERDRAALKREKQQRHHRRRQRKLHAVLGILTANALLVYMIAGNRIHPCYGAGFAAVVSAYLGYQLRGA